MPCHHQLEAYLDDYIRAAGIGDNRKGCLLRATTGKTRALSARPIQRGDVWRMVRRRTADAGVETPIGCHTFRASDITDYLTHGGRIEVAQRMAGQKQRQNDHAILPPRRRHQRRRSGADRI